MLTSILILLKCETSFPIPSSLGRPIQAWFLNQVMQYRPGLAGALHDEDGPKPYAVSTLLDQYGSPFRPGKVLQESEKCWLRITTLGDEISGLLLENVLRRLPNKLTLYKIDFRIDGHTLNSNEHAWAGQTTFSDISQDARFVKSAHKVRMEFVSPTAFRSSGNDIALPLPGQIFRSLWYKWNTFAPEPMRIQDIWPAFAEACIIVSELTAVNTIHWQFAEGTRGAATGFTGTVGFTLLPKSKIHEKWQPYWDGAATVMQSLAQFAFYAGVGHHSTVGMGQARQINYLRVYK